MAEILGKTVIAIEPDKGSFDGSGANGAVRSATLTR
jgi:hypothetical protein